MPERRTTHQSVPLYFNPDDPHDASLTRDGEPTTLPFALAIGLALLSAPFWYLALRMARATTRSRG